MADLLRLWRGGGELGSLPREGYPERGGVERWARGGGGGMKNEEGKRRAIK